ncbi:hypothetical protein ACFOD1_11815 [Pseudidiomarina halophila]|uniref:YbjN domain-containing protein n=1 Tax=Pseudidiomarina halophila TaxID=1449799 RepID=A0A432XT81_9GAMM|nr:hypothetical protein [Pseudidiomarina halophila]RUO51873.1 hypothetical protein CWI69_09500 [Pseudidiomarina halophila]
MRNTGLKLAMLLAIFSASSQAQVGGTDAEENYDKRVKIALQETDFNYEIDEDGDFKLVMEFDDARSQVVYVSTRTYRLEHLEIREVWSIGHVSDTQLSAELANQFLSESSDMILGGWEQQTWGDQQVVIFRAKMSANASGETLASAIGAVSQTADDIEKELVGTDEL